ncbi:TetR/AcrR family transcriptional regulator [Halomicrobium salinisoli]|uniref:TetR/AcrR family transcriptional regulator n=1 Tax=Halomicrobium salinisoli TaxID=2878391 RepID=UPI001CF0AD62|nr:TetR/AcrR family transcriptional regulator [Halomicrobium salinisoli]
MEDEPATEILEATYRALCEHGYDDLTLRDVAAEADRSKASIHYHYESKDQLFVTLLEYLSDRFVERVAAVDGDTPRERLDAVFEVLVSDAAASEQSLGTAMFEVAARAPHDDAVRDRLAAFDDLLFERFRSIVAAGVAAGEFDDRIEPDDAAETLVTGVLGAHVRQIVAGRSSDRLYAELNAYAERQLLAGERPEVTQ